MPNLQVGAQVGPVSSLLKQEVSHVMPRGVAADKAAKRHSLENTSKGFSVTRA